jgi:hypothetical protein
LVLKHSSPREHSSYRSAATNQRLPWAVGVERRETALCGSEIGRNEPAEPVDDVRWSGPKRKWRFGPVRAPFAQTDFALGRRGCRRRFSRRLRLEPKLFLAWMIYSRGFARCEALMNPLSASDVFLMVAIMSGTFLTEVGLFILVGMLWTERAIWATRSRCVV